MEEIALKEFDEISEEVIQADMQQKGYILPEKAIFAFLGDEVIEKYVAQYQGQKIASFDSITKCFDVYSIVYEGQKICLCAAWAGAAGAVMLMEMLIGYGVKKILAVGSCGCLVPMEENTFLFAEKALRDEGTSFHYQPASRWIHAEESMLQEVEEKLNGCGIAVKRCAVWTTDAFFRETKDKVEKRKAEGCEAVDMECSALIACAKHRGVQFAQLLYTADTLAESEAYDIRTFGKTAREIGLGICLKAII